MHNMDRQLAVWHIEGACHCIKGVVKISFARLIAAPKCGDIHCFVEHDKPVAAPILHVLFHIDKGWLVNADTFRQTATRLHRRLTSLHKIDAHVCHIRQLAQLHISVAAIEQRIVDRHNRPIHIGRKRQRLNICRICLCRWNCQTDGEYTGQQQRREFFRSFHDENLLIIF